MKQVWLGERFYLFLFILFLAGCSAAPGTYVSKSDLQSYRDTQGRLLNAKITTIDPIMPKSDLSMPATYAISPFDVLNITVWDHPELAAPTVLSTSNVSTAASSTLNLNSDQPSTMVGAAINPNQMGGFVVNQQGDIDFPYAGTVHVSGCTPIQAQNLLEARLSKYIRHPQVTIQVNYLSKRIHILGEVVKPGEIGLTAKPISFMEALDMAGGLNSQTADTAQVFLVRGNLQGFKVYVLNGKNPMSLIAAEHFYVMPDDIMYAAPSKATTWNRVLSEIWPTVQMVWYTQSVINNT